MVVPLPFNVGFIVAGIVLAAHTWFLFFLETEFHSLAEVRLTTETVHDYVSTIWIPIFFASIFIEVLYTSWIYSKKSLNLSRPFYQFNDSLSSMGTGSILLLLKKTITHIFIPISPYYWIWTNYGLTKNYDHHLISWWVMFFGVEFGYYWIHRTGHTISTFWALHGVHHSSEFYNLTTALRQSTFHSVVSWIYYLPLAFFFPPSMFLLHAQFNLLYQFWIHTEVIGKLGFLEYVINTPSQHRVHHARNKIYIDKNFGGTLCIFDRLFGTFQEEIDDIKPVYGITHALNNFNSLQANITPLSELVAGSRSKSGRANQVLTFYNAPGWKSGKEFYGIPPCTLETVQKFNPGLPLGLNLYIFSQFIINAIWQNVGIIILVKGHPDAYWTLCGFACYVMFYFVILGDMLNRKWKRPFWSEVARLLLFLPVYWSVAVLDHSFVDVLWSVKTGVISVIVLGSLIWISLYKKNYFDETWCTWKDTEVGKDFPNAVQAEQEQDKKYQEKLAASKLAQQKPKTT